MNIFDLLYFGLKVLFASFAIMLGIWLSCWCAGFIYCVGELASVSNPTPKGGGLFEK